MKRFAQSGGKRALMFFALLLVCVPFGVAQGIMSGSSNIPAEKLPSNLGNVGIDQRLDAQVPLDLPFRDESGNAVTLGNYFKPGRPVVLSLVYYDCPMLCTEVLNGMSSMLSLMKFQMGKDYEVVTVSFDPREKPELAAAKKAAYMKRYGRPDGEDGWHFLTGNQASITALTNAVGFHYQWDEKTQQFAHATGIMILTPEGRVSRYFYGVEYAPKDVRLGLVEASEHKIGTPVDAVLLYCYHYDPRTGKYGPVITNLLKIAGVLTILVIGTMVGFFLWLERGNKKLQPADVERAVGSRAGRA